MLRGPQTLGELRERASGSGSSTEGVDARGRTVSGAAANAEIVELRAEIADLRRQVQELRERLDSGSG
jgi:uncharacterized protein YceH (UPF0502 family)